MAKLEWQRPAYTKNEAATWKIWKSKCQRFRVIRSRTIGPREYSLHEYFVEDEDGNQKRVVRKRLNNYPDIFYAQEWTRSGWEKIGETNTETKAKKICEKSLQRC